jgi:hypothetical protein
MSSSCFESAETGGSSYSNDSIWNNQAWTVNRSPACLAGTERERPLRVDSGCLTAGSILRLQAQSAAIENGFVHVPAEAPWLADTIAELTAFPMDRHDDPVGSTS